MKTTRISPPNRWINFSLKEIWDYKELIYFLTLRNIKVRYKQTAFGIAWALIQPVSMMLVFTIFFGRLAKVPSDGIPYPLFSLVGLLPWQLFSRILGDGSASLISNQRLITRVYFPRIIVPFSVIIAALVDFFISFIILVPLFIYYDVSIGINVIFLPMFIFLLLITGSGVGFWLSAINVKYRDIRYVLPFLTQFWLFITPIAYSSTLVPHPWGIIYGINPMAGVVDGFRWAVLGTNTGPSLIMLTSVCIALITFITGFVFFTTKEQTFADILGSGDR